MNSVEQKTSRIKSLTIVVLAIIAASFYFGFIYMVGTR